MLSVLVVSAYIAGTQLAVGLGLQHDNHYVCKATRGGAWPWASPRTTNRAAARHVPLTVFYLVVFVVRRNY